MSIIVSIIYFVKSYTARQFYSKLGYYSHTKKMYHIAFINNSRHI